MVEIMDYIGLKDRVSFKRTYLIQMLEEGLLSRIEPDKPTSRNQKYISRK